MKGDIVTVVDWTPGLEPDRRYVIAAEISDRMGPMLSVRELGADHCLGPYWAWRFRKVKT